MAVSRKAVASNGKTARPSRMKRFAMGAAVVGAFVAGAVAGVNKNKIKAYAKKTGRTVKSKLRVARSAAVNKAADLRERVTG
jgi:hypothetical protein